MFSPFKFCDGTIDIQNGNLSIYHDPDVANRKPEFFVLDFAGSGAVHLLGGMGGLLLSVCLKVEHCLFKRTKKDGTKRNEVTLIKSAL